MRTHTRSHCLHKFLASPNSKLNGSTNNRNWFFTRQRSMRQNMRSLSTTCHALSCWHVGQQPNWTENAAPIGCCIFSFSRHGAANEVQAIPSRCIAVGTEWIRCWLCHAPWMWLSVFIFLEIISNCVPHESRARAEHFFSILVWAPSSSKRHEAQLRKLKEIAY